jgi:iron(III) transport system substrate-binding protein
MSKRLRRAAIVACAALGACSGNDGTVVLYVSADDHVARPVVRAFEEATGLAVRVAGDSEATKTTGLANRLLGERDNPQADVFWSSEVFNTVRLAEAGVLESWHPFAARARVIVYSPARVAEADAPRTWMDLTRPRFRGRIVMADPRFGTTGGHLGAMKAHWSRSAGAGYYEAFLMGLADNEVRMLPGGNAGVVRAVADGEADLGLTDTDDVWAAQAQGLAVDLVYPRHDLEGAEGGGTLLIPNTVALVRGGPNPGGGARLVEFLRSERVERMLAESTSHNVPLRPELAAEYPQYAVPDPLAVDYAGAAALMPQAIEEAMRLLAPE